MKDLRFRVWDKVHKKMRTDVLSIDVNDASGKCIYFLEDNYLRMVDAEVMLFTGLEDKNGEKIYFEDIVEIKIYDEDSDTWNTGTARIVETINFGVGIHFEMDDEGNSFGIHAVSEGGLIEELWEDDALFDVEVIGNIYENPKLVTLI
jgi:uncharacterized phage protein (TIGR01671 family)